MEQKPRFGEMMPATPQVPATQTQSSESRPTTGGLYICGVFETRVILGRISPLNRGRAEDAMQSPEGFEGEQLEAFASGTRRELTDIYPALLVDAHFDAADRAYAQNRQSQVTFERAD